jgi:hypothetical protein
LDNAWGGVWCNAKQQLLQWAKAGSGDDKDDDVIDNINNNNYNNKSSSNNITPQYLPQQPSISFSRHLLAAPPSSSNPISSGSTLMCHTVAMGIILALSLYTPP